jgi:hypothetical protein
MALQTMLSKASRSFRVSESRWYLAGFIARGLARRKASTYTGQHKHNVYIHASGGIRPHNPNGRMVEESKRLTLHGHCDLLLDMLDEK